MNEKLTAGIYVPTENRTLVPFAEWMKGENPQSAQSLVLVTDILSVEIAKKNAPCGDVNWETAQEEAAKTGEGFRCMTRHEAIEIYDWRFKGLDKAMEAIGGGSLRSWFWTCESDSDPEYSSSSAFVFGGYRGRVTSSYKYNSYSVRPVSAFHQI